MTPSAIGELLNGVMALPHSAEGVIDWQAAPPERLLALAEAARTTQQTALQGIRGVLLFLPHADGRQVTLPADLVNTLVSAVYRLLAESLEMTDFCYRLIEQCNACLSDYAPAPSD